MKPTEVPPQAEPTPSRTRTDACHAPCHRSRDPGHERVVTGTNPRRPGLSPTIVAGSARTWPARPDSTCSERGRARARRDHLGQHRQPEAFCTASLHALFLDGAHNAVGAISHHLWGDGGSARGAQHILSFCSHVLRIRIDPEARQPVACRVHLPPQPERSGRSTTSTDHHAAHVQQRRQVDGGATSSPDETAPNVGHSTNQAVTRRCRRPASTADTDRASWRLQEPRDGYR